MFSHSFRRVVGAAVAAVLVASIAVPQARGQTEYTWEGNADEFWGTGGNWVVPNPTPPPDWLPGAVPTASDTAVFDNLGITAFPGHMEVDLGAGAAAGTVSFRHTVGHLGNYTLLGGATLTLGEGLGMPGVIEQAFGSGPVADNTIASDLMDAGDGLTVDVQTGALTLSGRIGDDVTTVPLDAIISAGSTLRITHNDPSTPNNIAGSFYVTGGATLEGKGNALAGQPITLDNGTLVIQGGDPYMGQVAIFDADFQASPT
ncbi:MAG TPA: hypothetical protein VM238_09375, partial [Phycisphaerae bacterium]|nr:hypothetical protein [Phycisphaerae bacterium]